MRKQLTEAMVTKLAPPETERLKSSMRSCRGLAVRVTPNGAKSYVVRGRVRGQASPIRLTVGDAQGMKLTEARRAASDALRAMRAGTDPREVKKEAVRETERAHKNNFAAVAEDFIQQHVSKLRSKAHTEAEIRRYLIAAWGNRPISAITAEDIGELIRAIVDAGKPHMARLVLAHAKRLFRWASAPGRARLKATPASN